jgi:hypothetical protein
MGVQGIDGNASNFRGFNVGTSTFSAHQTLYRFALPLREERDVTT